MILTPLTDAAIRAHFALGRVLDDVLDDPFADDAEARLSLAAHTAHDTARAAGLLDIPADGWLALTRLHPDYQAEQHRHRLAVERRERPARILDQLEAAVSTGDRDAFRARMAELLEPPVSARVLRWIGGAL